MGEKRVEDIQCFFVLFWFFSRRGYLYSWVTLSVLSCLHLLQQHLYYYFHATVLIFGLSCEFEFWNSFIITIVFGERLHREGSVKAEVFTLQLHCYKPLNLIVVACSSFEHILRQCNALQLIQTAPFLEACLVLQVYRNRNGIIG